MKKSLRMYYEATDGCFDFVGIIGIRHREKEATSDIIKNHIKLLNEDADLLEIKITMYYVVS